MTNHELVAALKKIGELYPRFKVTELIVSYWHKSFIKYSALEFDRAFDRHIEASSHAPSIADMKTILVQMYGTRHHQEKPKSYPRPYTRLDFCMDVLGARFVSDELKLLTGVTGTVSWGDIMKLASRKDGWVTKYQATMDKIFEYAKQQYNEGHVPTTQWFGTEQAQPWSLEAVPETFNNGGPADVRFA